MKFGKYAPSVNRGASLVLVLMPALLALFYIHRYGVDAFWWDRWAMVDLIAATYTGDFVLSEAFRQHTNHRPFFSRLVILSLGQLTGFNTQFEMLFSLSLQLCSAGIVFLMYWRDRVSSGNASGLPDAKTLILFAPATYLMFTLRQHINFTWGWQIQVYLAVFGVVVSIWMLETSRGVDLRTGIALAGGILASFSYMPGLGVWILGAFYLIVVGDRDWRRYAVWIFTAALSYFVFFNGWSRPPSRGSLAYVTQYPLESIRFFVLGLGAPISDGVAATTVAGATVLLLYAVVGIVGIWVADRRKTAKWLTLIAFALGSSFMTTIGRVYLGPGAAIISRYTTITVLGLVGAYLVIQNVEHQRLKDGLSGAMSVIITFAIVMSLVAGVTAPTKTGIHENSACLVLNYEDVSDGEISNEVYHTPSKIREYVPVLERNDASVFSDPTRYNCDRYLE